VPPEVTEVLTTCQTIAVVGLSPKACRPSHQVACYLMAAGYRIVPVNPGHDELLGLPCYPDLASIPTPIDLVNIFRPPRDVPPVVAAAIRIKSRAIWMQVGIIHAAAARQARAAGLLVVMDRCLKTEHLYFKARPDTR